MAPKTLAPWHSGTLALGTLALWQSGTRVIYGTLALTFSKCSELANFLICRQLGPDLAIFAKKNYFGPLPEIKGKKAARASWPFAWMKFHEILHECSFSKCLTFVKILENLDEYFLAGGPMKFAAVLF